MMKAIKELEEVFESPDGVNEYKLISWLLGAKRDWISKAETQPAIDQSSTFSKGSLYEKIKLDH
jgi:hypothetical protein